MEWNLGMGLGYNPHLNSFQVSSQTAALNELHDDHGKFPDKGEEVTGCGRSR